MQKGQFWADFRPLPTRFWTNKKKDCRQYFPVFKVPELHVKQENLKNQFQEETKGSKQELLTKNNTQRF